ncbi:carbohydrate sulfotransferase 11-like [Styela clava]
MDTVRIHLIESIIICVFLLLIVSTYMLNVTSSYSANLYGTGHRMLDFDIKAVSPSKINVDEMLATSRNETLRKRCGSRFYNGTINSNTWDRFPPRIKPRLHFSDEHKLIACTIPKSGSTSWIKALLMADGIVNVSTPNEIEQEDAYKLGMKHRYLWLHFNHTSKHGKAEINRRLNDYYRIIIVREPLERVVSAYLDKVVHGKNIYAKLAHSLHKGTDGITTFEEFVDSIISRPSFTYDIHWNLYESICDPCRLQYHYIVKLETMSQDVKYVSKMTGIDSHLLISEKTTERVSSLEHTWKIKYRKYLEDLPIEKVKKLYKIYSKDYELFGYPVPSYILPPKNNSKSVRGGRL